MTRAPLVVHAHGKEVGNRARCDDHPGRVDALITDQPLERASHLHDALGTLVRLNMGGQLAPGRQCLLEIDADALRHELGDAVHLGVGNPEHPTGVAYHRAGHQLAKGANAGNRVATVLLRDVGHDAITATHREVGVDVGQALATRVEEAFEQQPVFERIEIGDT